MQHVYIYSTCVLHLHSRLIITLIMYLLLSHRSTKELMSSKKKSDETECSLDFIMEATGGKHLSGYKAPSVNFWLYRFYALRMHKVQSIVFVGLCDVCNYM